MKAADYRRSRGLAPAGADRAPKNLQIRVQTETVLQIVSADWIRLLRWAGPAPMWTHPANERKSFLETMRCQRMGQRAGIPDLIFWLPGGRTLALELKVSSGSLSKQQREVHAELEALGHPVVVCRSVGEVRDALLAAGLEFSEPAFAKGMREAADGL